MRSLYTVPDHRGPHLTKWEKRKVAKKERLKAKKEIKKEVDN